MSALAKICASKFCVFAHEYKWACLTRIGAVGL